MKCSKTAIIIIRVAAGIGKLVGAFPTVEYSPLHYWNQKTLEMLLYVSKRKIL